MRHVHQQISVQLPGDPDIDMNPGSRILRVFGGLSRVHRLFVLAGD